DSATQPVLYPGQARGSMHGVASSKDGSHVYVTCLAADPYPDSLHEFVTNSGIYPLILSRSVGLHSGTEPLGIALSTNGTTAYVCLAGSNTLAEVNLATSNVVRQIGVGVAPYEV